MRSFAITVESEIKTSYLMPVVKDARSTSKYPPSVQPSRSSVEDVDAGYVSNKFPIFTPKDGLYDDAVLLAYLMQVLNSPSSLAGISAESQASTKTSRNRLGQTALLKMQVQLHRITRPVKALNAADALRDNLERVGDSPQSLRDAFGG